MGLSKLGRNVLPVSGADGDYGSETEAAARLFQADVGLSGVWLDGIVGPLTLRELDVFVEGTRPPKPKPKPVPGPDETNALEIKNHRGPDLKACGEAEWVIQWELDKPATKGGHIVQEAVRRTFIQDCDDNDITMSRVHKRRWHYWEAWEVSAGQKITVFAQDGDPEDDLFSFTDQGRNTRGQVVMQGTARFHEGLTTLPSGFTKNNPDTLAGPLPSTASDPALTGGTPIRFHDLTLEWDCCPDKTTTKIIGSCHNRLAIHLVKEQPMTTFPNSPKFLKGAIVLIDPITSAVQRIIFPQYSSDAISRTLQVQEPVAKQKGAGVNILLNIFLRPCFIKL